MKRWHEERDRMLRLWRHEIAVHEEYAGFRASMWALAPIPPVVCDDSCHCYRGPGYFRKRHPFGCASSGCMCKCEKHDARWRKSTVRRRAIRQELMDAELI